MGNLWTGRFEKGLDAFAAEYGTAIGYYKWLYPSDIKGSIAHVTMLAEQGIVTVEEKDQIVKGLERIKERLDSGELEFDYRDEDVHMGVEGALIRMLGETGKKLHTARSRNDQVAVDTRLYLKEAAEEILSALIEMEEVLLTKSERYVEAIMPGFTHMQHAQPVTVGFHLMAYFQMFRRDAERLLSAMERVDYCPLGSCALAGTTLPINRQRTAELLGFSKVTENAMDSVSDRDYLIEIVSAASLSMMHISRLAEEIVWWNSQEFAYAIIDDSFCTGSSIMPQKKNPDMAELLRGKVSRVYGDLIQLLTMMKGTPLAYNKDFQEDKDALFDAVDTWIASLRIFAKMIERTEFDLDRMRDNLKDGFLNATDIAEHLVTMGIPFREAHEIVGTMVKTCEHKGKEFQELTEEELREIDGRLGVESLPDLSMEACVKRRVSYGGTAPGQVTGQIGRGREWLERIKETGTV